MMNRTLAVVAALSIAVVLASFTRNKNDDSDTLPAPKPAIRTLIIDPGHGGFDGGAKGSFSSEAEVSLQVSMKLGKALEKEFPEMKIVYTRTTDIMPGNKKSKNEGLRYRADLANSSAGDLFIAV